ncbi:MAG: M48 family metallopeptidase [Deltaproteobacteria bacterium]|nr:M48 family metallopeptidase [Deltaproteobacteria bacterium]
MNVATGIRRMAVGWLLLLSFSSGSCALDLISGKKSYNWFSLQDDIKFGQQVMEAQRVALLAARPRAVATDTKADAAMYERLKRIVARLAVVSHRPNFPYVVRLAQLPIVNAWCAPGGQIMVYTGLWDAQHGLVQQRSDDELAAVLAHEIAHATARHVTESLTRNMTMALAGSVASSIIATQSVEGGNLFQQIFSEGVNVFIPSYSRRNELEADRIGLTYMAKAGYDPRTAIVLWERAASRRGAQNSIYASHPSSGVRAERLRAYLPEVMPLYEAATRSRARNGARK